MILVAIICYIIGFICVFYCKQWKLQRYLLKHFKCPPRHPILGTLHLMPSEPPGIFAVLQNFVKTYGKNFLFCRPLFHTAIFISDAKDIEKILSDPNTRKAKKGFNYKFLEPWLGTGLLTAYGDKWFARRKIITPSFHFSILDGFVEVMSEQTNILIKHLTTRAGKGEFDIYPLINAFALDVICETSMGVTVNAQADPSSEYVVAVKKISTAVHQRSHHPLGKFSVYNYTSKGQNYQKLIKILHDFTNKVITERREKLTSEESATKQGRMNFLDILLHATIDGKPLTNEDIREEVDTFMFEGHDTTASGISFTLYLLSRHPDVQERLYRELMDEFGSKDNKEIKSNKLNEVTYLDMVIKESLRMFPPVPAVTRELMEETIIGGTDIPPGITIIMFFYAMQHDPKYFPEPEKFDPERFDPSNQDSKHTFTYVPFSAGGRNCIGQKFALLDMKTSIAKIVMNFKLFPGPDVILQGDLILKSANGVKIQLEER